MSDDQLAVDPNTPVPSSDKLEAIARKTDASKEQVAQLARATADEAKLDSAAAAAARGS